MKLNRRKIVAREFLILMSCIIVFPLAYVGTFPYNYVIESKIQTLRDSTKVLTIKVDNLVMPVTQKEEKQKWLFDVMSNENIKRFPDNYIKAWSHFEGLAKSDSLIYKAKNEWNVETAFFNKIGFTDVRDFNQFIKDYSFTPEELNNKSIGDSLKIKLNELKSQIDNKEFKILDFDDKIELAQICFIIIVIIAFPIRYIIYAITWSIKTLKQIE